MRRELIAVHARHLDVEQDDVDGVLLQHGDRVETVARRINLRAAPLEQAAA